MSRKELISSPQIGCAVFIGIELLQGNPIRAFALLDKGQALLHDTGQANLGLDGAFLDALIQVFERLRFVLDFFDDAQQQKVSWPGVKRETLIHTLKDIGTPLLDAQRAGTRIPTLAFPSRKILFIIMGDVYNHIQRSNAKWQQSSAPDVDMAEENETQRRLESQLSEWSRYSNTYCQSIASSKVSFEDAYTIALLKAFHSVAKIWLSTFPSLSGWTNDSFQNDLEAIVEAAESMLEPLSRGEPQHHATFETGFLPPLYLVAVNSRDRDLRRRALCLLKIATTQDCAWDKYILTAVAKRVVQLEEDGEEWSPKGYTPEMDFDKLTDVTHFTTDFASGTPEVVLNLMRFGHAQEVHRMQRGGSIDPAPDTP